MLCRTLLLSLALPASVLANAGGEAPDCEDEPPLSRAAAELLLGRELPSSELVSKAVRDAGSDVVLVRGYYFRVETSSAPQTSRAAAQAWLADFKRNADAPTVCGFAQSAADSLLLVSARAGSLAPLSASSTRLRGRLFAGFHDPELVIADGHGDLTRMHVEPGQLARGIPIPSELSRPASVQLVARGPAGPRPVAERFLPAEGSEEHAGQKPATAAPLQTRSIPPSAPVEPASSPSGAPANAASSPSALAQQLTTLRRAQRRSALRANALLERVAEQHARNVCVTGRIVHEPTPGENPEARLLAAGVQARRVGETVARAETPKAAFAAFERSPSHRLTLLEPGFTDAGVGIASDAQGRYCVVIMLAEWPRYVGR